MDFGKIETVLPGFDPQWTVQMGVEELMAAYRSNNLTMEDFEGSRFVRLKTLRLHQECGRLDANLFWVPEAVGAARAAR